MNAETETITLVAIIVKAGRYDHLSRGKGSIRNARANATQWAEQVPEGFSVPTGTKPATWYRKSSDGFQRTEDSTMTVPARATIEIPAGLTCAERSAAIGTTRKAAGIEYPAGTVRGVWE